MLYLQFGTPQCILKCTYIFQIKQKFSQRISEHMRQDMGLNHLTMLQHNKLYLITTLSSK